jgi:hypothetical protein
MIEVKIVVVIEVFGLKFESFLHGFAKTPRDFRAFSQLGISSHLRVSVA